MTGFPHNILGCETPHGVVTTLYTTAVDVVHSNIVDLAGRVARNGRTSHFAPSVTARFGHMYDDGTYLTFEITLTYVSPWTQQVELKIAQHDTSLVQRESGLWQMVLAYKYPCATIGLTADDTLVFSLTPAHVSDIEVR